jgi:hypothetical protein
MTMIDWPAPENFTDVPVRDGCANACPEPGSGGTQTRLVEPKRWTKSADGQSWAGIYACPGCGGVWRTTWHRDLVWLYSPEAEALARDGEADDGEAP